MRMRFCGGPHDGLALEMESPSRYWHFPVPPRNTIAAQVANCSPPLELEIDNYVLAEVQNGDGIGEAYVYDGRT